MKGCLVLFVLCMCSARPGDGAGKKVVKEKGRAPVVVNEVGGDSETGSVYSLDLEHSIGSGGVFKVRGTLTFRSSSFSLSSPSLSQDTLTDEDVNLFEKAALNNDYYYIRIKNNITSLNEGEADYVMSLTSACGLLKSSLKDIITIHGDGQGGIISVSVSPVNPALETGLTCTDVQGRSFFTTMVRYTFSKTGTAPNVQSYLQRQEAEKAKKDNEDNRSFLQKYWLHLVIGFVGLQFLMSMSGGGGGTS